MNNELLKQSEKVKKDADKILKDLHLKNILSKYGKVKFVGSYDYGLMLNEDIDLHVIVDKLDRENAIKILNEFIVKSEVLGYMFFDWMKYSDDKFPTGYYLGLNLKADGYEKQWKIDIWLRESNDGNNIFFDDLIKDRLNQENKLVILDFKQKVRENKLKIPSNEIYKVVLDEGIVDWEEFKKKF